MTSMISQVNNNSNNDRTHFGNLRNASNSNNNIHSENNMHRISNHTHYRSHKSSLSSTCPNYHREKNRNYHVNNRYGTSQQRLFFSSLKSSRVRQKTPNDGNSTPQY